MLSRPWLVENTPGFAADLAGQKLAGLRRRLGWSKTHQLSLPPPVSQIFHALGKMPMILLRWIVAGANPPPPRIDGNMREKKLAYKDSINYLLSDVALWAAWPSGAGDCDTSHSTPDSATVSTFWRLA